MILIGHYDSPFVRRVAVALRLYGMTYEHRPWSVFSDAEAVAAVNPLTRVPTLVLDDGTVLIESGAILDRLDEQAGPAALIAPHGAARRDALKVCALATGLAEKAVSLFYERAWHEAVSDAWIARCSDQIVRVLTALETDRVKREGPFWFGLQIGHADIAATCALRFLGEAHPALFVPRRWPALEAHVGHCEALEPFRAVVQAFVPPR